MILVCRSSLALLLAAACRSIPAASPSPPNNPTASPDLESEENSWKQLGLRDYSFTYQPICMCGGSGLVFQVAVRDGKVTSFQHWSESGRRSARDLPHPTIDSLFAWVSNAYARKAAVVRVTYDRQLHFPANVSIDWNLNVIDDEFAFEVRNLRPIAGGGLPQR